MLYVVHNVLSELASVLLKS